MRLEDAQPMTREAAAAEYERAAAELSCAASHLRTAARHLTGGEVPRACAHALSADGHISFACEALRDLARLQTRRSEP